MKKLILLLLLGAAPLCAQIPNPQIPLTGNIGPGGVFPLFNSGNLVFASDANHTMSFPEMSAFFLKVTSSTSLTATRNLIAPTGNYTFIVENLTTGGQSIQVIGASGSGVTIANGATVVVQGDGTNYTSGSGSGGGGAVSSVFTRTGAVTAQSGDYSVGQITGAAPLASPAFTGTPTSPTPSTSDNSTNIATTAYTRAYVASLSYVTGSGTNGHCVQWGASNTLGDAGAACGSGSGGAIVKTNGTNNTDQTVLNFTDTATVKFTNPSGGVESATVPTATSSVPGVSSPDNSTIKATSGVYAAQSTSINGQTCTPGSSCTITAAATVADYVSAATCIGGVAFSTGLSVYDNQAPQPGCVVPASSTAAYLAYQAVPSSPQYGEGVGGLPAYWTHTDLVFYFTSAVNSGNVTWEVQTACPAASGSTPGTPTFGTAQTVTTTVPGTIGQQATATITNIAQNSVNSCPASGTTTPSQLVYRIFRSASDTAAGDAQLVGINLLTSRSQ